MTRYKDRQLSPEPDTSLLQPTEQNAAGLGRGAWTPRCLWQGGHGEGQAARVHFTGGVTGVRAPRARWSAWALAVVGSLPKRALLSLGPATVYPQGSGI